MMEIFMKESGNMIDRKEKEFRFGEIVKDMKGNGKVESRKEKEL